MPGKLIGSMEAEKKNTEQDTHGRIQISAVNWQLSDEHLFRVFFYHYTRRKNPTNAWVDEEFLHLSCFALLPLPLSLSGSG